MAGKANSLSQQYAEAAAMAADSANGRAPAAADDEAESPQSAARLLSRHNSIGAGTLTINDGTRQVTVVWGDGAASPELKLTRLDPGGRALEQPAQP